MRTLVVTFLVLCGVAQVSEADIKLFRIPLFHVSTDTIAQFKGRKLEYSARVNSRCQLDSEKPVDVSWRLPTGELKGLGFGEGGYVKMDVNGRDGSERVVGEIKFLKKLKIHWPLTVVALKDTDGQCQTAAFSDQPQGVIQNIKLVNAEKPVELLVTSVQEGQVVEQAVKF